MKIWNWLVIAGFAIILTACGGQPEEEEDPNVPTGGDTSMSNEWSFQANAQQTDDQINVEMHVRNESDEDQVLVFPTSQEYEIILENSNGEEVFRYSDDHMFLQSFVEMTFKPGEEKDFRETIPVDLFPAGVYTMTVELTVYEEIIENLDDPNTFTVTQEIEIRE
ncbi:BsuPI-related putative proteinase inhibitor [Shouchella patagoniensis]|uniref:BsuPI-related putative proteinase inhibitor n=1 Tax=Shouchella patagoniensis TaxID=228576 RepID=UPI0009954FEC|nr:BsuPI-related putative proteinase inhibitor [Shouchella patagoniensis]